ncbi:MAG: D-glycerate dehydrogenase [Pseudoxanthomonas sp.]
MSTRRARVWISQPFLDQDIAEVLGPYVEIVQAPAASAYTPEQLAAHLAGADAAMVSLNERIGAAEVAGAPRLRVVANVGVGYNNLDIGALTAAGVVATNTPDVLTETTAELGFALLMATARRIAEGDRLVRAGRWTGWSFTDLLGADLYRRTLGILGMGRIGQAIARRAAHGFDMPVLYHNRSRLPDAVEAEVGARYAGFDELLAQADHLVLVLPYTLANHHLIDAAALARMKPTATLVNIARGGIVDELALADALAHGRLAAAGLDVFEGEPKVRPELLALDNVVLTPHIGSASLDTRRAMVRLAAQNIAAVLEFGAQPGRPPSAINAEAVKTGKTTIGKR